MGEVDILLFERFNVQNYSFNRNISHLSAFPSVIGGTMPSSFQLKRTKKLRLPNLCSFHHGKSFKRNPSRVNGSALTEFSATLLRIADVRR